MVIDTRGRLCPEPLIMTKRALQGAAQGTVIEVLNDNDTACGNVESYLRELGFQPSCTRDAAGVFHITFTVGVQGIPVVQPRVEDYTCAPTAPCGDYAVVLRGAVMGSGDDALGALLMRSCVNSLGELDSLPSAIILYNGAVHLALEGTDTASSLSALAARGVDVVVCGTCVDFFEVKERLAAGRIGNMLLINNILTRVGHIIYP